MTTLSEPSFIDLDKSVTFLPRNPPNNLSDVITPSVNLPLINPVGYTDLT